MRRLRHTNNRVQCREPGYLPQPKRVNGHALFPQLYRRAVVSSVEMKILSLVQIMALSAVIVLPPLAVAQDTQDAAAPAGRGGHRQHAYLASLSPAERKELKAAKMKAKQDPAYQAAKTKMREAREAMRAALLKADPNIQPVLNKIPEGGHQRDS